MKTEGAAGRGRAIKPNGAWKGEPPMGRRGASNVLRRSYWTKKLRRKKEKSE